MTMHLVHPSLTTTGKQKFKRKRKFRNAEEARVFREAEEYKKKHGIVECKRKIKSKGEYTPKEVYRRETANIPSHESSFIDCSKKENQFYTGDRLIGIAVLHKSCLQPVFSKTEATEVARMRRG